MLKIEIVMKKILSLLLLLCGAVAVAQSDYKPMAVQGRTWWYTSEYDGFDATAEFGVRVGDKVDIDGVVWYKLQVIFTEMFVRSTGEFMSDSHDVLDLCYMRDDDCNVYTYAPFDSQFAPLRYYIDHFAEVLGAREAPLMVYSFGSKDDEWTLGNEGHTWMNFKITNINEVVSHKNKFMEYDAECLDANCDKVDMEYVMGIGRRDATYSEFVALPYNEIDSSFPHNAPPHLRYVTEGEDNTIIYEALGGRRIWEDSNGISGITADTSVGTPRYYNLQGIEVTSPSTPGIYIQVLNNSTSKVVVE